MITHCRARCGGTKASSNSRRCTSSSTRRAGSVGLNSLRFASRSILGDDAAYGKFLATIGDITTRRDTLAAEIKSVLDAAAFDNQPINEHQEDQLVRRARAIIDRFADLVQSEDDHHDNDRH